MCSDKSITTLVAQLEKELKGTRNELRQLRLMYIHLAEKVIPFAEADDLEIKATKQCGKVEPKEAFLKAVK